MLMLNDVTMIFIDVKSMNPKEREMYPLEISLSLTVQVDMSVPVSLYRLNKYIQAE